MSAATAEHVIGVFEGMDRGTMWSENWSQGKTSLNWLIPDTDTTIQGVMCCVHLDSFCGWLLMLSEPGGVVSYLACSFSREHWPWYWIHAESNFEAISEFVSWVALTSGAVL